MTFAASKTIIIGKMKGKFGKIGLLCLAVLIALTAVGVGLAHWQEPLIIEGTVNTGSWELGGSPGFWQNWDSHNTYTQEQIEETWLRAIDVLSDWLVPDMEPDGDIDISDMLAVFDAGEGPIKEDQFLRQYLATRLNERADRLDSGTFHLFSTYDPSTGDYPSGYLGLDGAGTLDDIIDAIESKHGTSPTDDQFEIMKNICEALNDLAI